MFPISQLNLFPWPLLYNWLTKGSSEISFIGFCVSAPNIPSHVWHRKLTRLARNAANLGALSILVGQAEEVGQGNSDSKRTSVDGQNPAPLGMPETLFFYGPRANKWFSGIVGGAGFFPHIMNPFIDAPKNSIRQTQTRKVTYSWIELLYSVKDHRRKRVLYHEVGFLVQDHHQKQYHL